MAQLQDERRIAENSSDPLKITHGEREESQQQQQQRPLAPSFQTEPTQVAPDDLNDQRRDELEVPQPQKKSILQKVKETAKTLLHIGNDHGEKEHHQQFEDEKDHDHSRQEVKEDTEGLKKETAQDLNSNFKENEDTEGLKKETAQDLNSNFKEKEDTEGLKKETPQDLNFNFNNKPTDGSAVSPGLDAFSLGSFLNDSDVSRDQEVANIGTQSTTTGSASDIAPLPVETARQQQEVATVPSQLSAGIPPISQSTEAASTARPYDDVQTDSYSDKYMAHQVHDIGTTDTPNSATHPVQSEFSQELPNLAPYTWRKEAPENEFHGKDESEKFEYSDPFANGHRVPEGLMRRITEEPAVETENVQQAAEDRWFDADDVLARAPAVKDQNPTLSHPGWEEFGMTEPISDKVEYADQDKVGGTEINRHADVSDELQDLGSQDAKRSTVNSDESTVGYPIVKDQNPSVTHVGSDELDGWEDQSVDEATYKPDKMAEEYDYENSKKDKSYGDEIYETDSTEKNGNSSNLGNGKGEYEVAVQEEAGRRTKRPSSDDEEGAYEETGKSLTDAPSTGEIVASSNRAVEEKAEGQNGDDDGVEKTVEDQEIQAAERN